MTRIFFDILEVNIVIAVIILVLCLLAEKLRKRYGASWMRIIWIFLAVRLMIPYNFSLPSTEIRLFDIPGFEQTESFWQDTAQMQEDRKDNNNLSNESPFTVMQTIDSSEEVHTSAENSNQDVVRLNNIANDSNVANISEVNNVVKTEGIVQTAGVSKANEGKKTNISYAEVLTGIWILGIVLGLLYIAFSCIHFYVTCKKELDVVTDKDLEQELIVIQKKFMGKTIPVYQSRNALSPMLTGIFSPKLVVPMLSRQWSKTELEMVVAHEICHYKNKDLFLKLLMTLVCCMNWFNPLVYLMKRQFFYDMELFCDSRVLLKRSGEERETYARMMLVFAGKSKQVSAFCTGFGEGKKRMKKRIDYMLDSGSKKKGIMGIVLIGVVIMTMTLFVSCGYKPYEIGDEIISGQTGADTGSVQENPIQEKAGTEDIVQEETTQPFDYNHEYNEMLRCYKDKVYLAGGDGIYRIRDGGEIELVYENPYAFRRGMEVYQNFLYFCGSTQRGENETATIYRMNLDTYEVKDALAMFSQVFDALYNISIYEDRLYVASGYETKRIGFEINKDGNVIRQVDETEEGFLFKEHNECMDLEWKMMHATYDSEEYWNLVEESKKHYYSVMDVAACKKLLQGSQVVKKYKDEMYSSLYIENADGTYEFLCDTRYYFPLLITDTGVYYCDTSDNIEYIDYQTKTSKPIYAIEGTDEVVPVNYDADYLYMLVEHNTGEVANGLWIEETQLVRVPKEGGSAEILHRFEGNLVEYRSLKRCAVYDNTMFFESHDPIKLDVKTDTQADESSDNNDKVYAADDYGQIVNVREEFTGENTEEITFYYEMENFYVNDSFENADKINATLQKIYDEYEQVYQEDAEVSKGGNYVGGDPISTPYDSWHLLKLTLAGNQYISIQYNNIDYMGGAHPYSHFDGITINCETGEEVSVAEILRENDDEILQQVSKEMGFDVVASWDEIDYYLTDSTIVFFYRMPNYWEDVVWEWKNNL